MSKVKFNTSRKSELLFIVLLGLFALILTGCSGDIGGFEGSSSLMAGGGIGGTGFSSGSVSSFGSIYSNGIHFDTRSAEIIIEGELVGQGDMAAHQNLKLGQIVRVEGIINNDDSGSAHRIYYDKTIEGPVSEIEILDPYTRRISILGQQIIADSQTQFVNVDLDTLSTDPGQVLEISGFLDAQDALLAAQITKKEGSEQLTVSGTVEELDNRAQRFKMGNLIVDFGDVIFPMPEFNNGDKVRAKGRLGDCGKLKAEDLNTWHPLDTRLEAERIRLEGIVLSIADPDFNFPMEIVVDDVTVIINSDTSFQGVDEADDLITGLEVLVTGSLVDGVVHANEIKSKYDLIMTSGTVTSLDRANQTFTIDPSWHTHDQYTLVRTSSFATIMRNRGKIHFNDIAEGDDVTISGWVRPDNSITAWIVLD